MTNSEPHAADEPTLRATEATFRGLLESAPDAMVIVDDCGRILLVNTQAERLFGYERRELLGQSVELLVPERSRAPHASERAAYCRGPHPRSMGVGRELFAVRKNGTEFPAEIRLSPLQTADGLIVTAAIRDLTDRKRADSDLRLHSVLVSSMAEGICLVRVADGAIVYTNPKFDRMLGYEPGELLGKPVSATQVQEDTPGRAHVESDVVEQELRESGEATCEVKSLKKDGSWIWCRVHVSRLDHAELGPVWVAVHEDITDRKQLYAKLLLSDRLAAVGTLAAGITHEINNPLAYVISNLDMLAEEIRAMSGQPSGERLRELCDMVSDAREGAERVRGIVGRLKSFSRPEEHRRAPVDVTAVLRSAIGMAQGETRRRARVTTDLSEVPMVDADEGQLGQVFINLLLNAAQSIPAGNVDDNEIRVAARADADERVVVEILDSGRGIAPETLGRIFDPFFTTRAVGEGTGLGLSICHGIVTALGGAIEVQSAQGKGSLFRVVLPSTRVGAAGRSEPASARSSSVPPPPSGVRRSRILVVDDDATLAATIRRVFGRAHDVTIATNGKEALDLLRGGRRFDAIVCDLMMPTMTGMDLYGELARTMPAVCERIVFITGGAFTPAARAFLDRVSNHRVEKPFVPQALRSAVEELMQGGEQTKAADR